MSAASFRVFTLGSFRVERNGETISLDHGVARPSRQLFKWLLSRRTRRLPRESTFEALWPSTEGNNSSTPRVAIRRLRHALEPDIDAAESMVVYDAEAVWIRREANVWVDADEFERLIKDAAQAPDPAELLEEADRLYAGKYLPDDLYDDWAIQRRDSLSALWTELQYRLSPLRERRGDVPGAIRAMQRLLEEEDRCDERAARELMLLLARHGRRSEALRFYQRLVEYLHNELDAEPLAETVAVQRQVATWAEPVPVIVAPAPPPPPRAPESPAPPVRDTAPAPSVPAFLPTYPFPEPDTLVGREAELRMLARALERGKSGGQVVILGAPAGSGKSTLVGSLVRLAASEGYLCLAGGSYDSGSPLPFGPIRDALADYLLSQPPDRLRADLADVLPDLAHVVPELRYRVEHADTSEGTRDANQLYGAVHAFLRLLTATQPVLLCLEDLHAADGATIGLIHFLARQTRRLPLVLICTYRSDEAPPPLSRVLVGLTRERLAENHRLAPFDEDETSQFIAVLLDGPPDTGLRDSLYVVTEGNPLFVEQLVRTLRDDGLVSQRNGVWEYEAGAGPVVPPLIRDVIGRRFERVGPRCRQMLALAAVFGQTFDYRVLSAALGDVDEQHVMEDLDEAVAAELVLESAGRYTFGHAMVREVLYDGVRPMRRSLLHEHAGAALEQVAGERATERAAELANHFLLARQSSETRRKALAYSLEAGRHAASASAHREALLHFSQAYDLLLQVDDADTEAGAEQSLEALEGRASAEWALGLWLPLVETCERLLARSTDLLRRARARGWIGHARQRTGDTAMAVLECDNALTELEAAPNVPEVTAARLRLLTDKAYLLFLQGRYAEQAIIGAAMVPSAEELARPKPLQWAHNVLALAAMGRGQVDESLAHFEQSRAVAEHANDRLDLAMALSNLGIQHQFAGDFAPARAELERSIAICREAAAEHRAINTMQRLGWVLLGEGDVRAASRQAEYARTLASRAADRWAADCHDLLGTLAGLRCDWADAIAFFEQALTLRERGPHVVGRVETLLGLGLVRQRSGDWTGARSDFEAALGLATEIDPSPWLVSAQRHLGLLLCHLHDPRGPDLIRDALDLAETMPRSIEYGPTLLAAVEADLLRDDPASALVVLESALASGLTVEHRVEALCALALALADAGEMRGVHGRLESARALAVTLGAHRTHWLVHWTAAQLAAHTGDLEVANVAFGEAVVVSRTAGLPHELARALAAVALLDETVPARSDAMLAESREIERRLGILQSLD